MASSTTQLPHSFLSKKRKILEQLAVPALLYDDLSPKGSIDEGIRDLIDEINQIEGCVTTSSCAGRVSVFLEGKKNAESFMEALDDKKDDGGLRTRAGVGGKGGGGNWLFVSHDPIVWTKHESLAVHFGMKNTNPELPLALVSEEPGQKRWVHFKFEPMILHILTASSEQAQTVLSTALQSGFRESGALNLLPSTTEPATPMVAVRSMGLALESIIGLNDDGYPKCVVTEQQLKYLVNIANERFKENTKRIDRFRTLLKKLVVEGSSDMRRKGQDGERWEDSQLRRERKRAEGLMTRSQQIKDRASGDSEDVDLQLLDQNT